MAATDSTNPPQGNPREFSGEELAEIIRRAAQHAHRPRETSVGYEEMLSVGAELGLDPEHLKSAAAEVADDRHRKKRVIRQKLEFFHHLTSYVAVIGGLFLLNLVTSPGFFWFVFPAIGWGIGLACHAGKVYLNEKAALLGVEELESCEHGPRGAGRHAARHARRAARGAAREARRVAREAGREARRAAREAFREAHHAGLGEEGRAWSEGLKAESQAWREELLHTSREQRRKRRERRGQAV